MRTVEYRQYAHDVKRYGIHRVQASGPVGPPRCRRSDQPGASRHHILWITLWRSNPMTLIIPTPVEVAGPLAGGPTARRPNVRSPDSCRMPVARPTSAEGGVLLMVRRLMKRFGVAVSVAAVVLSLSASAAFAGEVKGPPTGGVSTSNDTAAPAHANSICAFSGLNDYTNGQTVSQVQTAADSFKYYGLPKGTPGEACRGGSNPDNPPN